MGWILFWLLWLIAGFFAERLFHIAIYLFQCFALEDDKFSFEEFKKTIFVVKIGSLLVGMFFGLIGLMAMLTAVGISFLFGLLLRYEDIFKKKIDLRYWRK